MRFTAAQAALFQAGISFVHMAPDEARRKQAFKDFDRALATDDIDADSYPHNYKFMVCVMNGAGCEHVSVLFIEDEADCDPRTLAEALMIPAPIEGDGPMVVR